MPSSYIPRLIQSKIQSTLARGKSIMLLGPRQTGKSTLLQHEVHADLSYSFNQVPVRRRFELTPELLLAEIKGHRQLHKMSKSPIVIIDEIQKIPAILDVVQEAIDSKLAIFVLTGSSARKLKRRKKIEDLNLLPGRVIEIQLDALSLLELPQPLPALEDLLLNGSLPEVILQTSSEHKEELLASYVSLYLEDEIRAEALVRNLANYSRFLSLAATEVGNETNISNLSRELGISRHILDEYYQITEDCLVTYKIEPVLISVGRRRLTKAPKYLFFDLGVRRIAAGEGLRLPQRHFTSLFEQFIGIEMMKIIHLYKPQAKLRYWRDHAGPEVDYVIDFNREFLPIEVKLTEKPIKADAKHLIQFMQEYGCSQGYLICSAPHPVELAENILAVHWQMISELLRVFLTQ